MKNKLRSFETFRGFAALMIAAVHFSVNSPLVMHPLANGIFVHFFFTLSGFVIYLNYSGKLDNFLSIKNFLTRRLKRLYPIHIFFVFIFLLIEIVKYYLKEKHGIDANNQAFTKNNFSSLFGNIFLLQTFFKYNSFNTPSWSISAEYFTYISFAVFILMNRKFPSILYLLLGLLIMRIFYNTSFGPSTTVFSFIDSVYCFAIGCMSCNLYNKISITKWYNKNYNFLSIVFLLMSTFAIIKFKNSYYPFLTPVIFGFLLIFSAKLKSENFYAKFLTNRFFVYLGKISYSIYMSHLFVFWMITQTLRFVFKTKTYIDIDSGKTLLALDVYEASLIVVVAYVVTIVFSHFLYEKIEKKFYLFNH